MTQPIPPEQKHSSDGRYLTFLVSSDEPQSCQVPAPQLPVVSKQLGSDSEVHNFRVEIRHRPSVKGLAPGVPDQLRNHLSISSPVRGPDPHIDTRVLATAAHMVWPTGAGMNLHSQNLRIPIR